MNRFKEDLEYNIAFAKKMIKERGKLVTMVVGVIGTNRVVHPFFSSDDKEEQKQANMIKKKLRKLGATGLIVFTQVWGVKLRHPALYSPDIKAVDHPNRKKCLCILYVRKSSTVRVIIPIVEVFDSVEFGEQAVLINKTVNNNLWADVFQERRVG